MPRIAICGGPRTGKTTLGQCLAREHSAPLVGTDAFMAFKWDVVPDMVIAELHAKDHWILEGVQAGRVLRRWLQGKDPPRLDAVYWLTTPFVTLTDGQSSLAKGCATIFEKDVRALLNKRGVPVLPGFPPAFRPHNTAAMSP